MSFTTEDGVQPEGQGAASGSPYGEYLSRIPEEQRGVVEPVFKDWDANVTRRFQEASEFRRQWEPYGDLGITEYDPGYLQQLLQLGQLFNDQDSYKEWLQLQAQEAGLLEAPQGDPGLEETLGRYLSPLQSQLQELVDWRESQQIEAAQSAAHQQIMDRLEELRSEHGEIDNDVIESFALRYVGQGGPRQAVDSAFADYQKFRGAIERSFLSKRTDTPLPPNVAGLPDTNPEQAGSLADAGRLAAERLRQINRM